ncbi:flagellar protein FlaG [Pelagibius sp.]|uniref:flagellar protein FlaG n=1 Tax=Pelagibius sp. TaxID=1931238 RepID=UPI002638D2CA|nr:flagellar protein FlaG [Pelagibius sp.]
MDTKLLVSTALVAPQRSTPASSGDKSPKTTAVGTTNQPATVEAPGTAPRSDAVEPAAGTTAASKAVLRQSAPDSALTTYRDQDSGRLIVRVYDRESGDVVVEFPPEKAFRSIEEALPSAAPGRKSSVIV